MTDDTRGRPFEMHNVLLPLVPETPPSRRQRVYSFRLEVTTPGSWTDEQNEMVIDSLEHANDLQGDVLRAAHESVDELKHDARAIGHDWEGVEVRIIED